MAPFFKTSPVAVPKNAAERYPIIEVERSPMMMRRENVNLIGTARRYAPQAKKTPASLQASLYALLQAPSEINGTRDQQGTRCAQTTGKAAAITAVP